MDTNGLELIFLELKYCERCGGLWLRQKGESSVYCESCLRSEFLSSSGANPSYLPLKGAFSSDRRIPRVLAFCSEEGEA
jgi:hypothetical protein